MRFRKLGKTDMEVPVIGMGTWAIGGDGFWGPQDRENSIRSLRAGIETGKVLIDTAPCYGRGEAEEVVGEAIKGKRDQVFLATKCGLRIDRPRMDKLLTRESIFWEVDESLRRLQTDYIDLYQCHWPDLFGTPQEETATAMYDLQKAGKIRAIGVSNYSVEQMTEFAKYAPLVSLQPQYSLLERELERDQLPYLIENGMGVLSYGSLGSGLLSGKYNHSNKPDDGRVRFYKYWQEPRFTRALALIEVLREIAGARNVSVGNIAIAWTVSNPWMSCALVGGRTPEQVQDNLAAGDIVLTQEEKDKIEAAYKIYDQE